VRSVGFLATRHHPLLPYLLEQVAVVGGIEPVLLLDARDFGARDAALFEARTAGAFAPRALESDLIALDVSDHNGAACQRAVRTHELDLLVNAGTPRRIGAELLATPKIGVLNVHPGILPKYRGASCPEWAIYHGDPVGVTAHFMDAGLDSGPIVATRVLDVPSGMEYQQLRIALYRLQLTFMAQSIRLVLDSGLTPGRLPLQPDAPVFRPIPDALLDEVKGRLTRREYHPMVAA
jgi:folate-dependent phosphoribosylglycinamide formyltransferase PurN